MTEETPEIASADIWKDSEDWERDSIFAMGFKCEGATLTRTRLLQDAFRDMVREAYNENCTVCHIKYMELLDAAHIARFMSHKSDT